jgi:hypothetical protein
VCGSPEALASLLRAAAASFVALPGHEKPLRQIYTYDLPNSSTVTITLRVNETPTNSFVLRSLGHSPHEDKTLEAVVSCAQVQTRKGPP